MGWTELRNPSWPLTAGVGEAELRELLASVLWGQDSCPSRQCQTRGQRTDSQGGAPSWDPRDLACSPPQETRPECSARVPEGSPQCSDHTTGHWARMLQLWDKPHPGLWGKHTGPGGHRYPARPTRQGGRFRVQGCGRSWAGALSCTSQGYHHALLPWSGLLFPPAPPLGLGGFPSRIFRGPTRPLCRPAAENLQAWGSLGMKSNWPVSGRIPGGRSYTGVRLLDAPPLQ